MGIVKKIGLSGVNVVFSEKFKNFKEKQKQNISGLLFITTYKLILMYQIFYLELKHHSSTKRQSKFKKICKVSSQHEKLSKFKL